MYSSFKGRIVSYLNRVAMRQVFDSSCQIVDHAAESRLLHSLTPYLHRPSALVQNLSLYRENLNKTKYQLFDDMSLLPAHCEEVQTSLQLIDQISDMHPDRAFGRDWTARSIEVIAISVRWGSQGAEIADEISTCSVSGWRAWTHSLLGILGSAIAIHN